MIQKIPAVIDLFDTYISISDDCQKAINTIDFTVHPKDADGRIDYSKPDEIITYKDQPTYLHFGWTEEQSLQWSAFRQTHNQLYTDYKNAAAAQQAGIKKQLEQNISQCIAYDKIHTLTRLVAVSNQATRNQVQAFGFYVDTLSVETPLYTIDLLYEKNIPLNKDEQKFLTQLKALCQETLNDLDFFKQETARLIALMPALWEELPKIKDEFDIATNRLHMPPPKFRGSFSEMQYIQIPTAEEQEQRINNLNAHLSDFHTRITHLSDSCIKLEEIMYRDEDSYDDDGEDVETEKEPSLFEQVSKMQTDLFDICLNRKPDDLEKSSLEACSVDDAWQQYLEAASNPRKEIDKLWEDYIAKNNLLMDVNSALVGFLNAANAGPSESAERIDVQNPNPAPEGDDHPTEVINRYLDDLKNNTAKYYDVDDWHIILTHFASTYELPKKTAALQAALRQHPQHPSLLIRMAQDEAGEHRYKKAMKLFKQVEEQGGPHHPNFYYIKAEVLCQMQAPAQAIPLYNKLIHAEAGPELDWWRWNARERLMKIFAEQKNYTESIGLAKELLAINPDDEGTHISLAFYYIENNQLPLAETLLKQYLEKFPESAQAMEQLGHTYYTQQNYTEAKKYFEQAYETDKSENYEALYHAGNAYIQLKRFADAAICFEICLLHYKLSADYHLSAAQCYAALNMDEKAKYHYRMALKLDPDCKAALDALHTTNPNLVN